MSKIKIFALGGLNEDGKNMYVCDVDNDIFIFDAGLKYPRERMLGIDYIIPSNDYLKENYKKIKGIFITHGHESNMGALSDIIMDFPNIPIYGSKFTIEIIKLQLQNDGISKANLHVLRPHLKLNMGKNSVFPISVTHSIPDCFCYVLNTEDGAIVYTGDFIFDPGQRGFYGTDIGKLAYIGKQGVLCLMSESLYAAKRGFTSPNHKVNKFIRTVLNNNPNRIIMSVLPAHILRIQEIFDEVSKTNRKIVIMGKSLQDMINMAIKNKYLSIDQNKIGDLTNVNDKNIIILISDGKEKPYMNLERIIKGVDKFIKPNENDTIFITEPMYLGIEKRMVQIMDDIANQTGISKDNIILKLNGDVATIVDGELKPDIFEQVKVDEVLIDGKSQNDIGELVLKDREMLAENGIVIVCCTLNHETKEIIAGPEVLTRGFIYVKDNMDVLAESQKISEDVIKKNTMPGTKVDYNQIKQDIRDALGRYFYTETECKPIIITVMQEV